MARRMSKRIGRFAGIPPWDHNQVVAARKAMRRFEAGKPLTVADVVILLNELGNVFTLVRRAAASVSTAALAYLQGMHPDWCAACYVDTPDGHLFTGNCRHTPIEADL
jgi:hypothetical protein